MNKKNYIILLMLFTIITNTTGCSNSTNKVNNDWEELLNSNNNYRNSINMYIPIDSNKDVYTSDNIVLDYSNTSEGYFMIKYIGNTDNRIKILVEYPNNIVYNYDISRDLEYNTIPLTLGNGIYKINVYQQLIDNKYITIDSKVLDVKIDNEMGPFLYSNQYVNFDKNTLGISIAEKLYMETNTDIEFIDMVYDYVQSHLDYDIDKAKQIQDGKLVGYLPNINDIYTSGKGICFDYASMMVYMLRSQGIPTKLNIGYVNDVYHAWISVYTHEQGWIDNIIEFNGTKWSYIDPTFADTSTNYELKEYIGEGINYVEKYIY